MFDFDRTSREFRAKINNLLGKAKASENPENELEPSIRRMHEQVEQLRQAVTKASAKQQRLQQLYNRVQSRANDAVSPNYDNNSDQMLQINLLRGRHNDRLTNNSTSSQDAIANLQIRPLVAPILQTINLKLSRALKTKLDKQSALVDSLQRQLNDLQRKLSQINEQAAFTRANEQLEQLEARWQELQTRNDGETSIEEQVQLLELLGDAELDVYEHLLQQSQMDVAHAIAAQKRIEHQYYRTRSQADQWQRRAQSALTQGNETLAHESMQREGSYREIAETLQAELEEITLSLGSLKENAIALESKISEFKMKKALLEARLSTVRAGEQLDRTSTQLHHSSQIDALEQIEERVRQKESRVEAADELARFELDLESVLAQLDFSNNVDEDGAAIRFQVLEPSLLPGDELATLNLQLLQLSLLDGQEKLEVLRQAIIQAIATQKRIEQLYDRVQHQARLCQQRARQVLQKGDRSLARESIRHKRRYEKTAQALQALLERQIIHINSLNGNLSTLKSQISKTQSEQELFQVRINAQ
jgi:phage shock protein A